MCETGSWGEHISVGPQQKPAVESIIALETNSYSFIEGISYFCTVTKIKMPCFAQLLKSKSKGLSQAETLGKGLLGVITQPLLSTYKCRYWTKQLIDRSFFFYCCSITVVCILFPPQTSPPPSPASTLPLGFVHVSFIVVPENPSPHYPLPTPLWLLLHCS